MKALVEEVNTVQRRIKVELSAVDVKSAFDSVYRKLQQKARINGFRPGKAPMNVIRKMYGSSIAYDVADQLVRNHLFSAIEQQSLRPIAAPVLETMDLPKEDNDYSFSAENRRLQRSEPGSQHG
jgi:trigger factor